MCSLSDMPDIPMNLILDYVGFPSILSLQKVSSHFRNYIIEKKPDLKLQKIFIELDYDRIEITWISNSERFEICYEYKENGYNVESSYGEKVLGYCNYIDAFFKDFKLIMSHQKSVLEWFGVNLKHTVDAQSLAQFPKTFEETLKTNPVNTKKLGLGFFNGDEMKLILSCLNANYLKEVVLFTNSDVEEVCLNDVVGLEQWKNLKRLNTIFLPISSISIREFTHFTSMDVEFNSICAEDLNVLRQAAVDSSNFEMFRIECHEFNDDQRLAELFGIPLRSENGNADLWYFNTCRPGKVLEIDHSPHFKFNFHLIEVGSVPNGAEIRS